MGEIEWTDRTWNPVRGCSRISEGCRFCYAERMAARFSDPGMYAHGFAERTPAGPRWTGKVELVPEKLAEPLSWRKPQRVFVNSMSDLFHEKLSNEAIAAVFGVMAATPHITYQILTKRASRMAEWFRWAGLAALDLCACKADDALDELLPRSDRGQAFAPGRGSLTWPLSNVWLGVSVENRQAARDRVLHLLDAPAAVHFLSVEPLLEGLDLTRITLVDPSTDPEGLLPGAWLDALRGHLIGPDDMLPNRISWVIVGGESGPGARPCDVAWIRSIVAQCKGAAVPVFVKQLGAVPAGWTPDACFYCENLETEGDTCEKCGRTVFLIDTGAGFRQLGKCKDRKGGDPAEWPADLRVREMPEVARA